MSLLWSVAINVILNYGETGEAAHLNLPELCGLSILMSQFHMEVTTLCKREHKKVINILLESALGSWRWLNLSFPDTDVVSEAQDNSSTPPDVSLLSHSCCASPVSFSILAVAFLLCLQEGHNTIPTQLFFFISWTTSLTNYSVFNLRPTSCPSVPIELFFLIKLDYCVRLHYRSQIWGHFSFNIF